MSDRATIFGGGAEHYDRFRPAYPPEAIDVVTALRPRVAVDVGCGTGIAARQVAARGVTVIGVEPDPRMATVARRHGIDVTVTTIEDWEPVECDVLYAAQSWHWVDPAGGARIAAAAIRPGGRWVGLWNYENDDAFTEARHDVYEHLAPELIVDEEARGHLPLEDSIAEELAATGAFGDLCTTQFEWADTLTVTDAVQRLASHSAHRLLPTDRSAAIDAALTDRLGDPVSIITLRYETRVQHADRLG